MEIMLGLEFFLRKYVINFLLRQCLHFLVGCQKIPQTKLGKMPPRKFKETPVAVRMKVNEAYNLSRLRRIRQKLGGCWEYLGLLSLALFTEKLKLMEVWKTDIDLGRSRSLPCVMKFSFQES